jgi:L-alanine-DL-glutamate epimerase-like enolase superfamily enzyme
MRITGLETTLFAGPPGGRGRAAQAPFAGCVIELLTDAKLRGIAITGVDLRAGLAALTRRFLEGEDPRAAPAIWQRMQEGRARSFGGVNARAAMALLDVALWDLKAKANHEPLWKTLGGSRPTVNAVASCRAGTRNDKDLFECLAERAREFGFRSAIVRPGRDADADRRRLGRARKLLCGDGGEPELAIDAGASTPARAIRRLRILERRFDVAWIEVSASRAETRRMKKISDAVRAAVCAGRGLRFPDGFRTYFSERALDLVQVDLGVNGITGSMQLADAAFGFELPVTLCAAPGNIQAQLAGAMPYVMNVEVAEPRPEHGPFTSDVRIEGGCAIVGDAPGNGITLDRAMLARCKVDKLPGRGCVA